MTISNRQKNIVNPYATGYDYNSMRAKWIQAGIHDSFVNYGVFPSVGPLSGIDYDVTVEDLQAYAQMYPQNAFYIAGGLDYVSQDEANRQLTSKIAEPLLNQGKVQFYTSATSEESYLPENQGNLNNDSDNQEQILKQIVAQLVSIPHVISPGKMNRIRESFGLEITPVAQAPKEPILEADKFPARQESDAIDYYDWKNNILPGEANENIYYNPTDEKYYFTVRTSILNPAYYDVGLQSTETNRTAARNKGIDRILKFLGKYSNQNSQFLKQRATAQNEENVQQSFSFKTHLDIRPGSRWLYAATIAKNEIDILPDSNNTESLEEEEYTPIQKAKLLVGTDDVSTYVVGGKKNDIKRKSVYTLKFLKSALDDTLRVLRDYSSIMKTQNVSPDMISGFDIEREILKLETIYDTIPLFLKVNNIDIEDEERTGLEFCFGTNMKLQYVVVGGNLYTKGLGLTFLRKQPPLVEGQQNLVKDPYLNVFSLSTPRTMGFIYNALDIQRQIAKKERKSRPTWSAFLQEQVIPKIKFSASESERKKKAKDFRIKEPPNVFQRLDQVFKPTGADLRTISINQRDLFVTINSAVGSCDTAQSSLLKDVFRIYRVINGKMPVSGLIKEAAALVKSELINDQAKLLLLEDAERYLNNPAGLASAAERIVLNEVNCIVDITGDAIRDQILDPAGVPKNVRELIKREVPPPMSFSFRRVPNVQNYWALWKKALQKMLIAFIKQLIMGVIRDVIKAALGCGPIDSRDQRNNGLTYGPNSVNYGLVNLNDFLQNINVLSIAEDVGFSDKSVSFTQSRMKITTSPPKQNQVKQFISDVSHMTTPVEITRLLDGEAPEVLVNTIVEMVNDGEIDLEGLNSFAGVNNQYRSNRTVVSLYQESLAKGDTRYAVLGIDDTTLVNFFKEIGARMDPETKDILNRQSVVFPEDAFCDDRNTIPPNFDFNTNLSPKQILLQQQDSLDANRMKMLGLCDALKGKINFQLQLDDFFDSLPNAEIYELILQWIADLSNSLTESLVDSVEESNRPVARPADRFIKTEFGRAIRESWERIGALQYAAPSQRSFGQNVLTYRTPTGIQDDNHITNKDISETPERTWIDNVNPFGSISVSAPEGAWYDTDGSVSIYDGFDTSTTNPTTEPKNGHIYVKIRPTDFELYWKKGENKKTFVNGRLSDRNSRPDQNLPPYSLRIPTAEPRVARSLTYASINNFLKGSPSDIDIASVSNTNEPIYGLIKNFYFADFGRVRLPDFIRAISKPLFVSNIDDCISDRDDFIAKSIVGAIHTRLIKFFMNVGPMGRAYVNWNTPDTNTAVVGYLRQKMLEQFKERQLFGPMIQNMEKVTKVFGEVGNSTPEFYDARSFSNEKFIYHDKMSPSDLLRSLIEQSYFLLMRRHGKDLNFFERGSVNLQRFRNSAEALRQSIAANGTDEQKAILAADTFDREDYLTQYSLYQLPGPLTVAAEIILFDYVVKLTDVYPRFKLETDQRIAVADDQFLYSINPSYLPLYSNQYIGLPITVNGRIYYNIEDLEEDLRAAQAACGNERTLLQNNISAGQRAVDRIDDFMSDIESVKDRIKTLIRLGDQHYNAVKLTAEVNDLGWQFMFRGDDEPTGGIKAEFLLSRWNWTKREVLATARGDNPPPISETLEETARGLKDTSALSLFRILHHVWTDLRGFDDDKPQTEWRWDEEYRRDVQEDYDKSVRNEPDHAVNNIVLLRDSINSLGLAYNEYMDIVRQLIIYGYAQISWRVITDSNPGFDGFEEPYKPSNTITPYTYGADEADVEWSIYYGTELQAGIAPKYILTSENNQAPVLPEDVRADFVNRISELESDLEEVNNCPDAEILEVALNNLRLRQRLTRGEVYE